jgi:hypothetical protein
VPIPEQETRRRYISGMARQRTSSSGSASWFDPSQVFADTQRVDLFNDPPWESTPPSAPRRAVAGEPRTVSWWTMAKTAVVNRVPAKRGLHSSTS